MHTARVPWQHIQCNELATTLWALTGWISKATGSEMSPPCCEKMFKRQQQTQGCGGWFVSYCGTNCNFCCWRYTSWVGPCQHFMPRPGSHDVFLKVCQDLKKTMLWILIVVQSWLNCIGIGPGCKTNPRKLAICVNLEVVGAFCIE